MSKKIKGEIKLMVVCSCGFKQEVGDSGSAVSVGAQDDEGYYYTSWADVRCPKCGAKRRIHIS